MKKGNFMLKIKFAGLFLELIVFVVMVIYLVRGLQIPVIAFRLFIVGLIVCTVAGILDRQDRRKNK